MHHAAPVQPQPVGLAPPVTANGAGDGVGFARPLRACLWGLAGVAGSVGLNTVRSALGLAAATLLSVHKCTQRMDGKIRWDLSFEGNGGQVALDQLRACARRRGWYVRRHVPYSARAHKEAVRPLRARRAVATLNIGTSRDRLEEFSCIMVAEQLAVAALQETLRTVKDRALRVHGCNVLEMVMDRKVPGARGVALVARDGIPMHSIGGLAESPNVLWARVIGLDGGNGCWSVASVYVPHAGVSTRKAVLSHIRDTALALMERYADEPVLIMGDWNMRPAALVKLLTQRWGSGLFAVPLVGSAGTNTVPGRAPTAIDHVVVNAAAYARLGKGVVQRKYNLSTHWPVRVEVVMSQAAAGADGAGAAAVLPRLQARKISASRFALAMHNAFEVLDESIDEVMCGGGGEAGVAAFTEAAREACAGIGAVQSSRKVRAPAAYQFTAATKRLLKASRAASAALHTTGKMSRDPVKVAAAAAARKAARVAQKADVARYKQQRMARAVAGLHNGLRPEVFWRFLEEEVREGPRASATQVTPVRDDQGALKVIPGEVVAEWGKHYRALSKAAGGRRGKTWWAEHHPLPQQSQLPGLNGALTWKEMVKALRATPDGTAPGPDGIPSALLLAALVRENGEGVTEDDEHPQTPLGSVLMKLATELWDSGEIPENLATATVVNVPKAGADPTEKDSYRGVSLIATVLKLLDRIVSERIYRGLMARRRLRMEQAGFLKVEECMGQVCALVETASRRARMGLRTYVAFIDLSKAFDRVSHGALMHRLSSTGVRGKALRFCEALYASPKLRIRVGGVLSEVIELETGVRQGAPSSPILFDVFIDSILEEMPGVFVPALPVPFTDRRMPGLLFADDAALTQGTAARLNLALTKLGAWADKWEMMVGHKKCGVMVLGSPEAHAAAKARVWMLQGKPIPVVDEYKYLGVVIDPELSFSANTALRVKKGWAALHAVRWLLTDPAIPLTVKATIYRSLVHPVLTYGGEVLGLSKASRTGQLQRIQNTAAKWMAVGSARANLGVAPLLAELSIPTVKASHAGAKVRAMVKFPTLKTWAAPLSGKRTSMPRRAGAAPLWSDRSKSAATRLVAGWRSMSPKAAGRATVKAVARSNLEGKSNTSVFARRYVRSQFVDSRGYLRHSVQNVADAPAVAWLTRARVGMLDLGHAAAAAGRIPAVYRRKCIACGKAVKDTLSHILVDCPTYTSMRSGALAGYLLTARELVRQSSQKRLPRRKLLALLLGGSTRWDGHTFNLGARWLPLPAARAVGAPGADMVRMADGAVVAAAAAGYAAAAGPQVAVAAAGNGNAAAAGPQIGVAAPVAGGVAGYLIVARAIGGMMVAHRQRLNALRVSEEGGSVDNGYNGAADVDHPDGDRAGRRHRRRANAWQQAGQLLRADSAVG